MGYFCSGWMGVGMDGLEDMEVWEVLYLGLKSPQPNLTPNQNQNQNQIYAFIISFPFLTFWVGMRLIEGTDLLPIGYRLYY
jgi:hypothetical protein